MQCVICWHVQELSCSEWDGEAVGYGGEEELVGREEGGREVTRGWLCG